jgi:hypothetical protein
MKKLLFCIYLIVISGCSLFATRDPESPDTGNQVVFIQPDRPEIVIQNFTNAINGLSIQNYLQCFDATQFEFTPSLQSASTNPGIWAAWAYQEEQTYFTNLASEASLFTGHRLSFNNPRYEILSETQQQFIAQYSLTIIHNRSASGVPTTAVGELLFDLEAAGTGLWTIKRWADISTGDAFSWSEFKAVFVRS